MSHPPPLLSPTTAPHIALGAHLRPPFLGMPSALCQAPGYSFLQPAQAQAELFARQQEMLRKQNLARLEMSAELQRQKELENLHQRQQLEHLIASLPPDHPALRSLPDLPEGHPLREELLRHPSAMLLLRHGAATPLLALHQQQGGGGASAASKEGQLQSSASSSSSMSSSAAAGGPDAHSSRKSPASRRGPQAQLRGGDQSAGGDDRGRESDSEAETKESDSEAELYEERRDRKSREKERGASKDSKEAADRAGRESAPCSSVEAALAKAEVKYQLPSSLMPPLPGLHAQALPFGFPYASPYFHTGSMGGLFMDGEDSATANPGEDISKWSVEDVCGFISSLAGCAEYTQVARRVGRLFYMTGFPLALPFPHSAVLRERDALSAPSDTPLSLTVSLPHRPASTSSGSSPYGGAAPPGCSSPPKQENGGAHSTLGGRLEAKTPS